MTLSVAKTLRAARALITRRANHDSWSEVGPCPRAL
jgi:hypothetical protein